MPIRKRCFDRGSRSEEVTFTIVRSQDVSYPRASDRKQNMIGEKATLSQVLARVPNLSQSRPPKMHRLCREEDFMIINLVPKADVMLPRPSPSLLLNITVVMHQRKSEMGRGKKRG